MRKNKNKVSLAKIKELRAETSAGVVACRRALLEAEGDLTKAKEILKRMGEKIAEKKAEREAEEGIVFAYIHPPGRVGSLVQLNCETDFVARTPEFRELAKEIAMQIASMNPSKVEVLLNQPYIRDPKKTIKDLLNEAIAKFGENIQVKKFVRFEVGE